MTSLHLGLSEFFDSESPEIVSKIAANLPELREFYLIDLTPGYANTVLEVLQELVGNARKLEVLTVSVGVCGSNWFFYESLYEELSCAQENQKNKKVLVLTLYDKYYMEMDVKESDWLKIRARRGEYKFYHV